MRAALFLEFARDVRLGKTKQRHQGRAAQAQAWRKDAPGAWDVQG